MKDENGLYYYPQPGDTRARVYVRKGAGGIEFRLWQEGRPEIWERHPWLSIDVVRHAADLYKKEHAGADPLKLYDLAVAQALLEGDGA